MEYLLSDQKEVAEMEVGKILPVEAAAILHASPQFVRIAMQQRWNRMHVPDEALLIKACILVTFSFKASFEVLLFYNVGYSSLNVRTRVNVRTWHNLTRCSYSYTCVECHDRRKHYRRWYILFGQSQVSVK